MKRLGLYSPAGVERDWQRVLLLPVLLCPFHGEIEEEAVDMKLKLDQIIAVCMFALGAVYLGLALNLEPPIMRQSVGPEAFPIGIAIGVMVCAVWLFIESWRSNEPEPELEPRDPDYQSMGAVFIGLLGYGLLLDTLGYFVTTVAFLILTIAALETGRNHWLRTIVVSVATSYAVFLVFDVWLGVTLPSGFLL